MADMKEAFEKIIERLEENSYNEPIDDMNPFPPCRVVELKDAIEIVNQVAEKYSSSEKPNMSEKLTSSGSDINVGNKDELLIHVMHGYDSLESPTGEKCFGCYMNGKHEIYVVDDIPKEQFFQTIAHEYMHYLQDIEGKDFDEEEADAFAGDINIGNMPEKPTDSKKLYEILLSGCDDSTVFLMDLSELEYDVLARVSEKANETSTYTCMPRMYINKCEN